MSVAGTGLCSIAPSFDHPFFRVNSRCQGIYYHLPLPEYQRCVNKLPLLGESIRRSACFSHRRFLTMSMLFPVSYSCRNFYLAMARYVSLWLVQVKQSQSNATLSRPNDLRRSFQMVIEPAAPETGSAHDYLMNRAFLMRFATLISNENLEYIYETRQSTAPPFAWAVHDVPAMQGGQFREIQHRKNSRFCRKSPRFSAAPVNQKTASLHKNNHGETSRSNGLRGWAKERPDRSERSERHSPQA